MAFLIHSRHGVSSQQLAKILREHGELLSQGAPLDKALEQLVFEACKLADSPPALGLIRVIDPETLAHQQDVRGDGKRLAQDSTIPIDKGVMARSRQKRRAQIVGDVRKDPDYLSVDDGVLSEIAVPLILGGTCWGILNLESPKRNHFSDGLIPGMEVLATQAAVTIQYDRLKADQQRTTQQREWSGGSVVERLQVDLKTIATSALSELSGKDASVEVLVLTTTGDALVTLAFVSDNPRIVLPGRFAPDSTVAWRAVRQKEVIEIAELDQNAPHTSVGDSLTATVVPLNDENGNVIGAFNVESPVPHSLTGMLNVAITFAQQAEVVLRNVGSQARSSATSPAEIFKDIAEEVTRLVDPQDLDHFYQAILTRAVQFIGNSSLRAAIALMDPEARGGVQSQLTITPERTYNYTESLRRTWSWPADKGLTGIAVHEQRSILVPDVTVPGTGYMPQDPTTRCELVVPLLGEKGVLGVIDIISPRVGEITDEHRIMIEALAASVVQGLDRAEQIRRGLVAENRIMLIRRTNRGIERMLQARDTASQRSARTAVLRDLLLAAMADTGSQRGSILGAVQVPAGPSRLAPDDEAELVLMLVEPHDQSLAGSLHFSVSQGITGEVYRAKKPLPVEDVSARPDFLPMLGFDVRSELAVPVMSGDRVLAVLNLESAAPRMYSPEQIASVELLASQAANTIAAGHSQALGMQLRRLIEIERDVMIMSLQDDGDPINRELQQRLLDAALELTEQSDGGYASFWLTFGDSLKRLQLRTDNEGAVDSSQPDVTKGGIIGLARTSQSPILALDLSEDRWQNVAIANFRGAKSDLAVPLLDPGRPKEDPSRVLGVLNLKSPRKLDFNHRDIEAIELLAQIAVIAMRNRDLYRGKTAQLRDVTHAFEKAIWPLQVSVAELRRPPVDPTQAGYVRDRYEQKVAEIASLTDMASNLFGWFEQLVRSESTSQAVEMEATSTAEIVNEIVSRMGPFARDVRKQLQAETPVDIVITCSPGLVQAALFLLIENALKYSPANDIVLVRLRTVAEGWARVEVVDHGQEIPDAERDFLFEPGFRGSQAVASRKGTFDNSGIGLAHVARIVKDIHHGKAGYQRQGDENIFFIELPPGPHM